MVSPIVEYCNAEYLAALFSESQDARPVKIDCTETLKIACRTVGQSGMVFHTFKQPGHFVKLIGPSGMRNTGDFRIGRNQYSILQIKPSC